MAFSTNYPDSYNRHHEPVCLEFNSNLFGNRKGEDRRDRNTGILVVCRRVVVKDYEYRGPRPSPFYYLGG